MNLMRPPVLARAVPGVLLLALPLSSCYPGDTPTAQETDVVVTQYHRDAAFGGYSTFAMADSVYHLTDETEDLCGDRDHDALILGRVASNFQSLGYTRLDTSQADQADVQVTVSLACSRVVVLGVRPPYWGGWPGYPGGWYPGYPGYYVAGTFDTGTIFIDMFDPGLVDADTGRLPAAWSAALNGVITETALTTRITDGIDQAFAQSAYLEPGP